nr:MAG TPA: helix-turn-helix domain protein [Bacteriophage sp.]
MEKMADALGINSPEQFMHVFFRQLSTKWTMNDAS